MKIDQVRRVTLHWVEGGAPTSHIVPASDVATFVEASKRLHWKPGINPHVRDRDPSCSKIWKITVSSMVMRGSFWWTVADLQNNNDPRGARIIDWTYGDTVFLDDEYVARRDAARSDDPS